MKPTILFCILLCTSLSLTSQSIEIQGELQLDSMRKDNSADSVVVWLSDSTLAIRDVSSLVPETGWTMVDDTTFTNKRVGIGTSSPGQQLHVLGNQRIDGRLEVMTTAGDSSLFIGMNAGLNNTPGGYPFGFFNTFIGTSSGRLNTTGGFNTSVGAGSLEYQNVAFANTAIGAGALQYNEDYSNNNTAVGAAALRFNETGYNNTAIGVNSLQNNTTGLGNSAIGVGAMEGNSTGFDNVAVGNFALRNNDTGRSNSAVGVAAMRFNTTGSFNTALGIMALDSNTVGDNNTALGGRALAFNKNGDNNTAVGYAAMNFNADGLFNTACGSLALHTNTSGNSNCAMGISALRDNKTGYNNTAIGIVALSKNEDGHRNTAVGDSTLRKNIHGNKNTAIGSLADVSMDSLVNATAIGYHAIATDSNMVRIGNDSVTVIEGQVNFSASSDRRLKEDIRRVSLGLDFINDLNPVQYHRINNSHEDLEMGVIAQELLEVLQKHGAAGMGVVNERTDGYMSVRYNDLLAPLIRAVQELSAENEMLRSDIKNYQLQLNRMDVLEASVELLLRDQQKNKKDFSSGSNQSQLKMEIRNCQSLIEYSNLACVGLWEGVNQKLSILPYGEE